MTLANVNKPALSEDHKKGVVTIVLTFPSKYQHQHQQRQIQFRVSSQETFYNSDHYQASQLQVTSILLCASPQSISSSTLSIANLSNLPRHQVPQQPDFTRNIPIGSIKMPPTTRSYSLPQKRTTIVLRTNSRPRFLRKLPLELREMVYGYMMGARTMEVKFMSNEEAEAYSESVQNARLSKNKTKQRKSKHVVFDNDTTDADYKPVNKSKTPVQNFRFVNTSSNKLILHAINQETRQYALRRYTHVFKTNANPTGILFNFDLDFLAFTTQYMQISAEKKFNFISRVGFQGDIARIRNVAYLFLCHYKELDRVHRGYTKTRTFVTRFPALKKFIVTLPLEHIDHCKYCDGGRGRDDKHRVGPMEKQARGLIVNAKSDFEELKQKMKVKGVEWAVPDLVYMTYCWNQRWTLRLDDHKAKKGSSA